MAGRMKKNEKKKNSPRKNSQSARTAYLASVRYCWAQDAGSPSDDGRRVVPQPAQVGALIETDDLETFLEAVLDGREAADARPHHRDPLGSADLLHDCDLARLSLLILWCGYASSNLVPLKHQQTRKVTATLKLSNK